MKESLNVGMDVGCNWTKVYMGAGRYAASRTSVGTRPSVSASLGLAGQCEEVVLQVGDSRYAVGPSVEEPLDTRYEGYHTSEHNLAAALTQLLHMKPDLRETEVNAVFGMPITLFYNNEGQPNTELMRARKQAWRVPARVLKGAESMALPNESVFGKLHGVSEGVGAFLDYHLNEDGSYNHPVGGLVCVVDVGGNTTDIGLFEDDRLLFGGYSTTLYDAGALRLYEAVAARAADKMRLRKAPSLGMIEKAVRQDGCWFSIGQQKENLRDIVAAERRALVNEVVPKIKKILTRRLDEVSTVIYAGGGAKLLERELLESSIGNANIVVLDEPQFANARGYYKYLMHMNQSQQQVA